ncbi:hypothetical protein NLJ89_g8562 [Agrocybe chaxingu]|uniref:Uncharacterized protein n=1 Tax=Agrocybe chaxingu TaxID=84603 RepID=A0A9W8K1K7_9AGAR|nr:hypothetical protein NLJ89_g8562 [Agrocybe chaxingu]
MPNPSFSSSSTEPDTSPSSSSTYPPVLSTPILATGGSDGRVITFSLQTYTPLHRIAAHDSSVTALQFSPSLGYLVTGGNDGRVRLFELASGRYVRELCEPGECVWKVGFTRSREGGLGPGHSGGTGAGVQMPVQGGGGEGEVLAITCKRGGKTGVDIWSMGVGAGKFQKKPRRSASGKEKEKAKEKMKRSEMDGKNPS